MPGVRRWILVEGVEVLGVGVGEGVEVLPGGLDEVVVPSGPWPTSCSRGSEADAVDAARWLVRSRPGLSTTYLRANGRNRLRE